MQEFFDILGVTFDSKITFKKYLHSVSRATSQRFQGFVLPILEYCSAVWCSAADTHLKLLDHVVSGALPVPYMSVRVTRGALVGHRFTYTPPCCRT